jgi:hypothetical protein
MKKTSLILGFMLMVVMLGGWSPFPQVSGLMSSIENQALAASGDPELLINNQTGAAFYVTLAGPESYTFQILPGKNTFVVAKGEYTLSYFACGVQQTTTVNVKKNGASIKLTCTTDKGKSSKAPKLTIDNKAGAPLYITLTGPKAYSFYAPAGKTEFDVEQGTYEISYYACGAQTTDTFLVKKKGGTLKILCVPVTVNNLTGDPFTIEFTGPANYYFNFPEGKTTISIVSGTYEFTISGPCGPDYTGTKTFVKKYTWFWYCN